MKSPVDQSQSSSAAISASPPSSDGLVRRTNLALARAHLPPPPCYVLEVGCGDGEMAADLQSLSYRIFAIDTDPEAVSASHRREVEALEIHFLALEAPLWTQFSFTVRYITSFRELFWVT